MSKYSPQNERNVCLVKLATWVEDYCPEIASCIGTILIAAVGIWFSAKGSNTPDYAIVIFVLAALLWMFGEARSLLSKNRESELLGELKKSRENQIALEECLRIANRDYFDLFKDQLSILANDVFDFSDNERISVYKHDGEQFIMLGRYCKNPALSGRGRAIYPDSEGCIAKAWENGEVIIEKLPDPVANLESYIAVQKDDWNIPKGTARALKMKSRSYAAVAIENSSGERVAVAVFESIYQKEAFDLDEIKKTLISYERKRIAQFLDKMKEYEPSPAYANKEGY